MTLQLTTIQQRRRDRKSMPRPQQAELFEPLVPLAPAPKPAEPAAGKTKSTTKKGGRK